jgi:glycosyltransferase involved in cell wall biosynthesis
VLLDTVASLGGDWRLRLVGNGPLADALAGRAAAHGLDQRVSIEAGVPSLQVPEKMRALDVLVLPSLTRPNWKEQFGRVLIEAMACGVAVVGSDSGEIPNVIGDAGLIVPEGDVAALADALRRLAADLELRRTLGRRGRERALAYFTQAEVARKTVEVYRQVATG